MSDRSGDIVIPNPCVSVADKPFEGGMGVESNNSSSILSSSSSEAFCSASSCAAEEGIGSGRGAGYAGTSEADWKGGVGSRRGGGASITSAIVALGASVELVLSRVFSASGNTERLVFVSEEATSVIMGLVFARSGVFDGGGGVGFPLSSVRGAFKKTVFRKENGF